MTLVHSRAALDELEARCPESVIRAVRMGIELPEVVSRDEARLQLGLGKQIVMASFGFGVSRKTHLDRPSLSQTDAR